MKDDAHVKDELPGQEDIFGFLGEQRIEQNRFTEAPESEMLPLESEFIQEIPEREEPAQEVVYAQPPAQEVSEEGNGFFDAGDDQLSFVDKDEWWKEHWVGMPEFIQDDLEPWKSMYVHFATREDMMEFAKLTRQTLTADTRSIWYPKAEIGRMSDKVFINGK